MLMLNLNGVILPGEVWVIMGMMMAITSVVAGTALPSNILIEGNSNHGGKELDDVIPSSKLT